jgi:alkylation response protein AidB-like acyl-CoA dehydrogenase
MKFSFSDEQEAFRESTRRFLADKSPTKDVRRLMETEVGYDPDVWRQLSQDLGITGIAIPEAYGGQGFGISELAIALEEAGRALLCAPLFASAVMSATAILKGASEDEKKALLPAIASGETVATLAIAEDAGKWDPSAVAMRAVASGDRFLLSGVKSFVPDGHSAGQVVVAAHTGEGRGDDGVSLFLVSGEAVGLHKTQLETADATRKLARLTFENVEAELIGTEGKAAEALRETMDIAAICLANEMVGGAARLLESAIEYANMRVQFGRPIGSFQSLKHKAADMLLDVELAKSAAYYAAAAVDEGDEDLAALAATAKSAAADAYMQTAIHTIQIHGGIGFTWDNDTHLWYKRAKSSEVFLGTSADYRERLMQQKVG